MATKSIGEILYAVNPQNASESKEAFIRKSAKDLNLKESWFQKAIVENPELIIGPCREAQLVPDDERWFCWKKEFSIETGSIDVLLLSSHGRVGIVETKLSYNPQVRREVVAQILDYALALRDSLIESLPPIPKLNETLVADEDDVRDSLIAGNFLLIIAGDNLDPRAIRLGEAILAQHFTSMWDLAMVDMNLYHQTSTDEHLLITELRGSLEHETRQTMRVIIKGETPAARVEVERVPITITDPRPTDRSNPWTIEDVFHFLGDGKNASEIKRIFDFLNDHEMIRVEGGKGPRLPTLSLFLKDSNEKIGTSWFQLNISKLSLSLRGIRLLELHQCKESELINRFTKHNFNVSEKITKDGYLTLTLPFDISKQKLDQLVWLIVL